jgi:hypothetical protein
MTVSRTFEIVCSAELEGKEYKLRIEFRDKAARRSQEYVFGLEQLEAFNASLFKAMRELQRLNQLMQSPVFNKLHN